jgi:hypothetical protein
LTPLHRAAIKPTMVDGKPTAMPCDFVVNFRTGN